MMWLWLRRSEPAPLAVLGGAVLVLYGAPTFQSVTFGRVYASPT
jgi:drug/metabolite transporter superfamily protein YnfA